jgi:hypothetical protein
VRRNSGVNVTCMSPSVGADEEEDEEDGAAACC